MKKALAAASPNDTNVKHTITCKDENVRESGIRTLGIREQTCSLAKPSETVLRRIQVKPA